jgi:hypothetical protein
MRNKMRTWMLGTALIAGLLGTGTIVANAAPREFRGPVARGYERGYERPVVRGYGYDRGGFGVTVGGPVAGGYIPPCPGDGYVWLGGAWVFRGGYHRVDRGYAYGPVARFDRGHDRGFDRGYRGRR